MEYKEESLNNLLRLQELWWQVDASCKDEDPDLFFPNRGASTRKAKQISAVDKVKKLNFLDEDVDNQITSIDPSKIIGAELLYLYNSKTNQLIYYVARDRGGFDVKGSSIKNFDEDLSQVKKLGAKTTHYLDRVLGGGKIVLNKTMNEINSKASKVTGRVNNNMIILKVI